MREQRGRARDSRRRKYCHTNGAPLTSLRETLVTSPTRGPLVVVAPPRTRLGRSWLLRHWTPHREDSFGGAAAWIEICALLAAWQPLLAISNDARRSQLEARALAHGARSPGWDRLVGAPPLPTSRRSLSTRSDRSPKARVECGQGQARYSRADEQAERQLRGSRGRRVRGAESRTAAAVEREAARLRSGPAAALILRLSQAETILRSSAARA